MRSLLTIVYICASLAALVFLFTQDSLRSGAPFKPFPAVPVERCGSRSEECFASGADFGPEVYGPLVALADRRIQRRQSLRETLEKLNDTPHAPHAFEVFPPVISCPRSERVGRFGDGGKWVCEPQKLPEKCTVFSFGGSDDLSFELEMHERYGCETHTFDPSPGLAQRMSPQLEPGMYYHAVGLGPTGKDDSGNDTYDLVIDGVSVPARTLAEISSGLGVAGADILKLDIEGSELTSIPQFLRDGTLDKLDIGQILVEIHFPSYSELAGIFDLLYEHGFIPFSRETNAITTGAQEYGFVKKSYLLR